MKIRYFMLIAIALSAIDTTFSTVGGKQMLWFSGYDQNAQKLYWLCHYEDESVRLPQLYYYHLKACTAKQTKALPQLIEVRSLILASKLKNLILTKIALNSTKKLIKFKSAYSLQESKNQHNCIFSNQILSRNSRRNRIYHWRLYFAL